MKYDEDSTGIINYDQMKSGMFDLRVPCNDVEQHLLCQTLDTSNSGTIDYINFAQGLHKILKNADDAQEEEDDEDDKNGLLEKEEEEQQQEEIDNIEPIESSKIVAKIPPLHILKTHQPFEHCLCCKMAICLPYHEKNPNYVELSFRLVVFEDMQNHPGHFREIVHTHLPIVGLTQMIQNFTGTYSTRIGMFLDNSKHAKILDETKTLQDYNIQGGPRRHAPTVNVYYDYSVEFVACPLLSCDHYFSKRNNKKKYRIYEI